MADKRRSSIGIAIGLLVIGLGFTVLGGSASWQEYRVGSFLPVAGRITSSEVERRSSSDGTSYYPRVRFRYEIGGEAYEDGALRIVGSGGSRNSAQNTIGRYPVGTDVEAFYDPEDPSTAVIETDMSLLVLMFPLIGLGMISVAVIVLVRRRRTH